MKIGLLADTHDRLPAVEQLLKRMADAGVQLVMHAGDYCAPFALRPFIQASVPVIGVFGRNDGDRDGLRAAAATSRIAIELFESPHSFELAGRSVLLVHDLAEVQPRSVEAHALVVYGCAHQPRTEQRGGTLLVNPGEACGWLNGSPSAAVLDLDTNALEFIKLEAADWLR
jgi:putative phosphoesterase